MTIGYRVYPLRNIVRIQALDLKPDRGLGRLFVKLAASAILTWAFSAMVEASGDTGFLPVVLLGGGAAMFFFLKRIIKAIRDTSTYAVLIETNGSAIALLGNKNPNEIERVYRSLHQALEENKTGEISITTFNIKGDQINQSNSGPGAAFGKVING